MSSAPSCPTCKNPMRPERPYISYETSEEPTGLGQAFPPRIEMRMFQNYYCPMCRTRTKQLVQIAVYEKPQIKEMT